MIVVDTNVVAYLVIPGDLTPAATALLQAEPDWCAPYLWRSELRNVLALYIRKGDLDVDGALELLDRAGRLLKGREYAVPDASVMRLVEASGCSAYDCEFVALAKELDVRVVTTDARVLKDFPSDSEDLRAYLPGAGQTS